MTSEDLLKSLTLKEKIRLLNGVGSWTTYDANKKLPVIYMSDGPHGLRKQDMESYANLNKSHLATCFPTASAVASSWNKEALNKMGNAIAQEAVAEKVNIVLGPGLNIKRSPLCGRNFEYFSEDPYLAGVLASEYVKGMQKNNVNSCLKHFACNNQEKRRQTSNSIIDSRTLNEIYLSGFEYAVKNSNPGSVMCSYNRINGIYASKNAYLLNDLLRKKWGFNGVVISDWGACMDAAESVKAGMDLAMPDSCGYITSQLEEAVNNGQISEEEIDLAVLRLLNINNKLPEQKAVDFEQQHKIAVELATDSAVLLKNNGILPLRTESKVVVIGEFAEKMKFQGGGSSHITTAKYPNAIETIMESNLHVEYEKGFTVDFYSEKKKEKLNAVLSEKAVKLAKKAAHENIPVLFFSGLPEAYEGEGFDRSNMKLPVEQLELLEKIIHLGCKVIVINFSGSPIELDFADNVQAILQMYLCGEGCSQAIADLISGKVSPSGKLAETFPVSEEDVPCYGNFALPEDNIEYKEKTLVGYRYYETKNIRVKYEFGFGLSYSTFEYSNLNIAENNGGYTVEFTVKNTGTVAAAEVAQVYVKNPETKIERAAKELRGFEKVFLQPGEAKTVKIELTDRAFSVYSNVKNDFAVAGGIYEIQVCASVKNVKLSASVEVAGEKIENLITEEDLSGLYIEQHKKGTYTLSDSLGDMQKDSVYIKILVKILENAIWLMNKGKSKEDPAVKIALSAIKENPLESLISTSGGMITKKFANKLVRRANFIR